MALCMMESAPSFSFARTWYCSKDMGHEDGHVAYAEHIVTDCGRDVVWLGPWKDGRVIDGPEEHRLSEEWFDRHSAAPCECQA